MNQNSVEIREQYESKYVDSSFREREFELYQKYFKLLLKQIDKKSVGFDSLIDLGCGDGVKTQAIAQFFNTTLGIDLSRSGIDQAQQLSRNKSISFQCVNMFDVEMKQFSCISALGFSYFNTKNTTDLSTRVEEIFNQFSTEDTWMFLSSFTDFSGNAQTGWVKHTKEEISLICSELTKKGFQVKTVFPHRIWANYFRFGVKNLILELGKRFLVKNKTFFIIVYK